MSYEIEFKVKAMKDLASMPQDDVRRVIAKVELLRLGLIASVKRLTNFTPEYKLRVGDHRVLFEIEEDRLIVHRVGHRKEAYR